MIQLLMCTVPMMIEFQSHPLDPLSKNEIAVAVEVIKSSQAFPAGALFPLIVLNEPSKETVLAFQEASAMRREAFAIVMSQAQNKTFEVIVDLNDRKVRSWKHVPDVQPLLLESEYMQLSRLVKADTRWQEAMRRRGISPDEVQVDGWAVGHVDNPDLAGARLLRAVSYYKGTTKNFYARPIEGILATVNLNAGSVVEVTDSGALPVPAPGPELDDRSIAQSIGLRSAPEPLVIAQPSGASYQIHGNEVRWQKWRFRFALHPREGLVLYTVAYEDQGKLRPILYRASLSEMAVPYGDVDANWSWRNAFDVGEYGMGGMATELDPKTDVPGNARLFDAVLADELGQAKVLSNRIGLYERDGGMLWRHIDYTGWAETRRARQLVIFFYAAVGNYDYAINWIFHQDGTLELDAALTGIMLPKGVRQTVSEGHNDARQFGHLVAANVVAPHHQHFFNFRLDLDIDGTQNSAVELNTRAAADDALNGMIMEETVFASERRAQRDLNMQSARKWAVVNPSVTNKLGHNSAFILVPGENSVPFAPPQSSLRKRAGFVNHHLWVTRYEPTELSAAGPYPNQSKGGDGLPGWVADDDTIENQDIVLWYTMGLTHTPRAEEWPVMPVTHVGFKLVPAGFFAQNPALDVPR